VHFFAQKYFGTFVSFFFFWIEIVFESFTLTFLSSPAFVVVVVKAASIYKIDSYPETYNSMWRMLIAFCHIFGGYN
jgi:hypothetical protein